MKITTYNVNGIRAALKKGFLEWLAEEDPDILCLQEIKAEEHQVPTEAFTDLGYNFQTWLPAKVRKGYSGVATLSKKSPFEVKTELNHPVFDGEGRLITYRFKDFVLINSYFPSGSSGDERQNIKYEYLRWFEDQLASESKPVIFCGDVNICHQEIDIHNPKGNKNSSGFLQPERDWVSGILNKGFLDCFRHLNAEPDHYTWWSYRANARNNNKGWRIDYFFADEVLKHSLKHCYIQPEARHSDHCPVHLVLNLDQY
jgi:exodeoxyribonuclease-3